LAVESCCLLAISIVSPRALLSTLSALHSQRSFCQNGAVTILDRIVEQKVREVSRLPERVPTAGDLREALLRRDQRRDFAAALHKPRSGSVALIAEVKKASPSAGVLCADFDPVRIAKDYEAAGASCLSVLTDEQFFQGSLDNLRRVRAAVKLPLLRKDFIIDERQILESIEWGADAILLIVAILDDARLRRFHALATEAGLAALVEVHDEPELGRALAAGARLIGVNNRNLKTFKVDLATTERLAARVQSHRKGAPVPSSILDLAASPLLVAESGIHTRGDVERLLKCGARAILVGESLVKQGDIRGKVRELLGLV
jgi:indole-3-glycerol phosphate synthase